MAEYEYRISPNGSGWHTLESLTKILAAWDAFPEGFGVPAVTITKRVKAELPDEPEFLTCRDDSPPVDGHVVECKRVIDHPRPHRDHRDPRKATRAWWRGGDDRIH